MIVTTRPVRIKLSQCVLYSTYDRRSKHERKAQQRMAKGASLNDNKYDFNGLPLAHNGME